MIAPLRIEARDHDGRELQAEMLTAEDIARLEGIHVHTQQGRRMGKTAAWEAMRAHLERSGVKVWTFTAESGRPQA